MTQSTPIQGMLAVYIYDGRVIADASDFNRSSPGGFTLQEAQSFRVKTALAFAVVRALSSPALYENLSAYDCEQIMGKMKGEIRLIPVGHDK